MKNFIKVLLSILFFMCLADMPYGFYELVRFLALVGFVILSYRSYTDQRLSEAVVYAALAILFQPLFKISLGRDIWNIVDLVVGIGLLVSIWVKPRSKAN